MKRTIIATCLVLLCVSLCTYLIINRCKNPFIESFNKNRAAFEASYDKLPLKPNVEDAEEALALLANTSINQIGIQDGAVLFLFAGTPIDNYHAIVRLPGPHADKRELTLLLNLDEVYEFTRIDGPWAYVRYKK
jgi:hypothetical protein